MLNLFVVIKNYLNGYNTPQDITFFEIQIACLVLSYWFLRNSLTLAKKNEDKMFEMSESLLIDELTKAYNRKFISRKVIPKFQNDNSNGISLAYIDIDHFGDFNDTYGHDFGDAILKHLSTLVLDNIKDISSTYFIRNGGDEFILVSFHMKYNEFVNLCKKIRTKIEETRVINNTIQSKITISIGSANSLVDKVDDFFDLRDYADKRLYNAKNNGRNNIVYQK